MKSLRYAGGQSVLITGASGLLGSAFARQFDRLFADARVLTPHRRNLDLCNAEEVDQFIRAQRVRLVIHCAGTVGGIVANQEHPAEFLFNNLRMGLNIIESARRYDVPDVLFMGSACAYPDEAPCPIKETSLLRGPPQPANQPYALAKLACVEAIRVCHKEGRNYTALMPCNLYGPGDNYHPRNSHLIPGIFLRCAQARAKNTPATLWGDGTPIRDFLYSDDAARKALEYLLITHMTRSSMLPALLNLTSGEAATVAQVAGLINELVGAKEIIWNTSDPKGTQSRFLSDCRYTGLTNCPSNKKPSKPRALKQGLREVWDGLRDIPVGQWNSKAIPELR